uniref:MFS domain-containing protein n=1 Tax=Meloidogyne hapla TaxID=6305 RepID=A0A1I8BAR1_MELHA
MLFAPVCGVLGDRFNRKRIILIGEIVWVLAVFASSFIPQEHFASFVLLRGIVGIGEASYAVVAPTFLADMFAGKTRSRVLMFFYFAIPVGSGLGYVIGSYVSSIVKAGRTDCLDCWQWGIRATPLFGVLTIIALIIGVDEPIRGQADREDEDKLNGPTESDNLNNRVHPSVPNEDVITVTAPFKHKLANIYQDLVYLLKNQTFVWSTIAYTAVVFSTGTLTWWAPAAIEEAIAWHHNITNATAVTDTEHVALTFGGITCAGGIIGVAFGTVASLAWKRGLGFFSGYSSQRADPLVSAIGSFLATPFLFLAIKLIDLNFIILAWFILFLTIVCLCLNWAVNVDMLMAIVVPHRRSIASAVQILISHAFGDASGPWIVGAISDSVRGDDKTPEAHFHSLVIAFYLPNALLFLSGITFLLAAYTLPKDLKLAEEWRTNRRGTDGSAQLTGVVQTVDTGHLPLDDGDISPSNGLNQYQNEAFDP